MIQEELRDLTNQYLDTNHPLSSQDPIHVKQVRSAVSVKNVPDLLLELTRCMLCIRVSGVILKTGHSSAAFSES